MRRKSITILIAILLGLTGIQLVSWAGHTVKMNTLSPPYRIEVYESGKPTTSRQVVPGSQEEQIITRWLQTHAEGWRRNFVTYAPARRIKGENFDLNFSGGTCVLNYKVDRGRWVQVSRTVKDDETLRTCFESK